MQVRDTPLLLNESAHSVTVAVGAGGSGVYYGPYREKSTLLNQGTPVAAGSTFSVTTPTWVVSQGGRDGAPADVVAVSDTLPGLAGSSGSPRGVWNSGLTIVKGDTVSYLNGSYMALNNVAPGGSSPAVDTANWMQLGSGPVEIAGPAEITANFPLTMTAATLLDVTGASLVIPAGSPAYEVVGDVPMIQFIFGAAAGAVTQGTVRLFLVDENNVALAQSIVRQLSGANSTTQWQQSMVRRRMPATAVAKTIKLSYWLDAVANITSITFWAGAGTGTPPAIGTIGPTSLVARAR